MSFIAVLLKTYCLNKGLNVLDLCISLWCLHNVFIYLNGFGKMYKINFFNFVYVMGFSQISIMFLYSLMVLAKYTQTFFFSNLYVMGFSHNDIIFLYSLMVLAKYTQIDIFNFVYVMGFSHSIPIFV